MGIYCIYNITTSKFYIGSTIAIIYRWYNHRKDLRNNNHCSKYLQHSYNKHGESAFQFYLIEIVKDKNKLLEREQWWLDITRCYLPEIGYNTARVAGSMLGTKQTKEHIEKRIRRGHKQSPEVIAKIAIANTGKTRTEETKKKMSEKRKGVKRPYLKTGKWPHELGNKCICEECRKQRNSDEKRRYHARIKFNRILNTKQES